MIDVTCAIIRNEDDKILIVQRGESTDHPLMWEFPGGKLQPGESEEECIIREIAEELSMEIVIVDRMEPVEHDYGFRHIRLIPFICDTLDEIPFLTEHVGYRWIMPDELPEIDFSGADITVASNFSIRARHDSNKPWVAIENKEPVSDDDTDLRSMVYSLMGMKEAEWLALSAIENPAVFRKLFEYSLSGDTRLAFRASWTLTKVCDRKPELIYPYLNELVVLIRNLDNESALRSFLRIISLSDIKRIDQERHGILADICFSHLRSGFSAIAVKAYSMEILYRLVLIYPELRNELSATLGLLQTEAPPGILSRGRQIMKKLSEMPMR